MASWESTFLNLGIHLGGSHMGLGPQSKVWGRGNRRSQTVASLLKYSSQAEPIFPEAGEMVHTIKGVNQLRNRWCTC